MLLRAITKRTRLVETLSGDWTRNFSLPRTVPSNSAESLFGPTATQHRSERIEAILRQSDAVLHSRTDVQAPPIKAVLVDAAGTLISPSEPAAAVYLRYAAPYGCTLGEDEILANFRRAYNEPWTASTLRYEGDARKFWRHIVAKSTGCDDDAMHEALYAYFARSSAWRVAPGAEAELRNLKNAGFKLAVVSNFDTRLRPILEELGLTQLFEAVIVSAEIGAEKPNPLIFEAACAELGVPTSQALVLGDDRRNDVTGGRDAGCTAWLFGVDVKDFKEASERLRQGNVLP